MLRNINSMSSPRLTISSRPIVVLLSTFLLSGLSGCDNSKMSLPGTQSSTESNISIKEQVEPTQQLTKATYVRTVEGIEEFQLTNGLKVLFVADPTQPKTLVNITYRVGSVHETMVKQGWRIY